jgi:alpha-D-xyloside xylohydrolase
MRPLPRALLFLLTGLAWGQWYPANPVVAVEAQGDGVALTLKSGLLRLQFLTDSLVHVRCSPGPETPQRPEFVLVKKQWPAVKFETRTTDPEIILTTARLRVRVDRGTGYLSYQTPDGKPLMQDGPRTLTPVTVNGEQTYKAEQVIPMYGSPEALYGLGQHQAGVWNLRGESVDVSQENANIAVPMLVSSRGWGLFWNNTSLTKFNNRFLHYVYITSQVADAVDYYFLYGPAMDRIVAAYRELTGAAPLFGKWAYGFWQCKNRYKTQAEILGVARKYRELHIPVDNIVQDWFWWTNTGEFVFNKNYPDPKGMIDELHRRNFHLMISVWPYFYPGSNTYGEMDRKGYFIDRTKSRSFHPQGMALYDAFNPEARKYYWGLLDNALFKIGADAWWLDTDEPETEGREDNLLTYNRVAIGNGARFANLYPLMAVSNVYDNQRAQSDAKRVFILSRSAFAGSQRYATTVWSGDINSDFLSFRRQIPGGLNLALSGIPYWTTDIGGFINANGSDPAYRELFVRWFQFGTFCPIFRVHGGRTPDTNEIWSYGPEVQAIATGFDRLRYRLMPYIYSLAWKVTSDAYTPMRPLVMDFPDDVRAQNIGGQFMYGPAFLVNPVTEPGARTWRLYLPRTRWYDFWTGQAREGGEAIEAAAPLERMPLYVRAGSIVPLGPPIEYAVEKPADPIELRVYPGADGDFTLYEDEGDTYRYEKGAYATIPLHWDDARRVLTIGAHHGAFPGMLERRTFRVVFVGQKAEKLVQYSGVPVTVPKK